MDMKFKEQFMQLWPKYFNDAELPITWYYTDEEVDAEFVEPPAESVRRCLIGDLVKVRRGVSRYFNFGSVGCPGGQLYLGFRHKFWRTFPDVLSCGIPGKFEGERYKKSPDLVREIMEQVPPFEAPGRFIVFKRWDKLEESDSAEVVVFFAQADVLAGLFTLANFDEGEPDGVISPWGSGCASIVRYPYFEKDSDRPRGVIGMLDTSSRPYVPGDAITFSVPMKKFVTMVANMKESFLITDSWKKVQKRIG